MRHADAFAGIGGFGLAARRAGWETVWAAEIEPSARSIYSARLGHDGLRFDVDIRESRDLPQFDILTGGFPCQDLSVAGKRAGLAGSRSGLFFELVRILEESRPRWFVFENVDALLSSNSGRDMGVILSSLVERGYCVAWRVLNSRYFGLAQRRARVFLVGHSTDWTYPAAVLFEQASRDRDTPSRDKSRRKDPGADPVGTLQAGGKRGYRIGAEDARDGHLVGACIARGAKGIGTTIDGQIVSHTLTSSGFDASEDGTGRGSGVVSHTLRGEQLRSNSNAGSEAKTLITHPTLTGNGRPALGSGGKNGGHPPPLVVSDALTTNGRRVDRGTTGPTQLATVSDSLAATHSDGMGEATGVPGSLDVCPICEKGPDGPRYRGIGNAVSVPVVEWIFRRINEQERAR